MMQRRERKKRKRQPQSERARILERAFESWKDILERMPPALKGAYELVIAEEEGEQGMRGNRERCDDPVREIIDLVEEADQLRRNLRRAVWRLGRMLAHSRSLVAALRLFGAAVQTAKGIAEASYAFHNTVCDLLEMNKQNLAVALAARSSEDLLVFRLAAACKDGDSEMIEAPGVRAQTVPHIMTHLPVEGVPAIVTEYASDFTFSIQNQKVHGTLFQRARQRFHLVQLREDPVFPVVTDTAEIPFSFAAPTWMIAVPKVEA